MIITTGNPVSLTTAEHRNQTAAMLPPANVPLAVRGGVHSGLAISKTSGMSFRVAPGRVIVCPASPSAGPYTVTVLDPETLSFAPGDATRSRIDIVAVKVDESQTTSEAPASIVILQGAYPATGNPVAPTVPAAHEPLLQVPIPAGLSSGTGGWVPTTATDLRHQLASIGSYVPVRSISERDTLATYEGLTAMRLDLGGSIDRYVGGRWRGNTDWIDVTYAPGWETVPNAIPARVRVLNDGMLLQVWGEVIWRGAGTVREGATIGQIPASFGITPYDNTWVLGTDDMYKGTQVIGCDNAGRIKVGPSPTGTVFMFQGTVPLEFK